jgi:hypothetical protein
MVLGFLMTLFLAPIIRILVIGLDLQFLLPNILGVLVDDDLIGNVGRCDLVKQVLGSV